MSWLGLNREVKFKGFGTIPLIPIMEEMFSSTLALGKLKVLFELGLRCLGRLRPFLLLLSSFWPCVSFSFLFIIYEPGLAEIVFLARSTLLEKEFSKALFLFYFEGWTLGLVSLFLDGGLDYLTSSLGYFLDYIFVIYFYYLIYSHMRDLSKVGFCRCGGED